MYKSSVLGPVYTVFDPKEIPYIIDEEHRQALPFYDESLQFLMDNEESPDTGNAHGNPAGHDGYDGQGPKQNQPGSGFSDGIASGHMNGHANNSDGHDNIPPTCPNLAEIPDAVIKRLTDQHIENMNVNGLGDGHMNDSLNGYANSNINEYVNGDINGLTNGNINEYQDSNTNWLTNGNIDWFTNDILTSNIDLNCHVDDISNVNNDLDGHINDISNLSGTNEESLNSPFECVPYLPLPQDPLQPQPPKPQPRPNLKAYQARCESVDESSGGPEL